MAKKVTIYTTNTCAYCGMVKMWLQGKGQTYEEVNIDSQPDKRQEMMKYTIQTTVPLVVVKDDTQPTAAPKMMQGFNLAKLAEAIA